MRVLGEALYSTPNVVVRELVQNAHDSLECRRLESELIEPRITVRTETREGQATLIVEDSGAGLTEEEVRQYLATIGAGKTRNLRDEGDGSAMIGYFGLGFLSTFVVARRTEVWTCSHQTPDKTWHFSSHKGDTYTLRPADSRKIGTTVALELKEEHSDLADPEILRRLLDRYCCLLRHPLYVCGEHLNAQEAPWRSDTGNSVRQTKQRVAFAKRFEGLFDVISAATMGTPARSVGASGLLWLQDSGSFATSDHRNVSVFVRGMFISDEERDLLPAWAGFVGAVVECDSLKPTASRETLQRDDKYDALRSAVREELVAFLARMPASEPDSWRRLVRRHNDALRGAALSEESLFDVLSDSLTLPTNLGEQTVPHILAQSEGVLYISEAESGGFEELMFRSLNVPVLLGHRYGVHSFCKAYVEKKGGRVVVLGTKEGNAMLLKEADTTAEQSERLKSMFGREDTELVFSRFEPSFLPFVLLRDRDVLLKNRIESDEADKRMGSAILSLARHFTSEIEATKSCILHINIGCPSISALLEAPADRAELGGRLLAPLVELLAEPAPDINLQAALTSFAGALELVVKGSS